MKKFLVPAIALMLISGVAGAQTVQKKQPTKTTSAPAVKPATTTTKSVNNTTSVSPKKTTTPAVTNKTAINRKKKKHKATKAKG